MEAPHGKYRHELAPSLHQVKFAVRLPAHCIRCILSNPFVTDRVYIAMNWNVWACICVYLYLLCLQIVLFSSYRAGEGVQLRRPWS